MERIERAILWITAEDDSCAGGRDTIILFFPGKAFIDQLHNILCKPVGFTVRILLIAIIPFMLEDDIKLTGFFDLLVTHRL